MSTIAPGVVGAATPRIRLLGELTAESDSGSARPQSGRVAALLALLALEPGRVVSAERLMAQLWEDDAPQSGLSTLYVYISRLRRQLRPLGIRLSTKPPGYSLNLSGDEIDIVQFSAAVRRAEVAQAAGDPDGARIELDMAEALWCGEPFQNAARCSDLTLEAQRLHRLRDRMVEIDARSLLDRGNPRAAAELARTLTDREPLNEAFWALRMESEHALGNTGIALAVYEEFRTILAEALGIDPGRRVRELHTILLRAEATDALESSPGGPHTASLPDAADDRAVDTIGRKRQLEAISEALADARRGRGAVVVLDGHAGVGKTFLAEHAARLADAQGFGVAWTRAVESTGAPPLWPWQRILGQLPDAIDTSGAADLVALRARASDAVGTDEATFRLADAIAARVVAASRVRPLLIVLDDLQWADAPTQRVVTLLASGVRGSGCVLVVTVRHPEAQRMPFVALLAMLTKETATRRVSVPTFTIDEVRQHLQQSRGVDRDASVEMSERLLERTGGNAFFLSELLGAGLDAPLPTSVTELIGLRVAELDDSARNLLESAAIAGLALDPQLLAAAAELSLSEVLRSLDELCSSGLLRRDGSGFSFVHSLARDAVLVGLAPHRVVSRHTAIADAIELVHGPDLDPHLERLGYHRFEAAAGSPDETAFLACTAAADRAREGLAFDQAAVFRGRALETVPRDAFEERRRAQTLRLLTEERRSAGDVQSASLSLRQALRAAHRLGERDLAIQVLSLLGGVTLWNWRQFGEVDVDTVGLLESILSDAAALTDRQRVELRSALTMELYYGDDTQRERALALSAAAVDGADRLGDPDVRARAYSARVFALWRPGKELERRAAVTQWLQHPGPGEVVALLHRSSMALAEGDLRIWTEDIERVGAMVPRLGRAEYNAQYTAQLACMAMQSGRSDDARELIERTYATLRRTSIWGGEWGRWVQLLTLARIENRVDVVVDDLVAVATQDSHRALRWSAVLALLEAHRVSEARAMQARWNLRGMPRSQHWGTEFEVAQAAEVALALGTPLLSDAYSALSELHVPLIVAGTGLAVWGARDELLARVAARLGRDNDADRHRTRARELAAAVGGYLGAAPCWPIAPHG